MQEVYLIDYCTREPNNHERGFGFGALAEYKDPIIENFIIYEVHSRSQPRFARQQIAQQLKQYPSDEAINALIFLLQNDDDAYVKEDAAESLLHLNRPSLSDIWKLEQKSINPIIRKFARTALKMQF